MMKANGDIMPDLNLDMSDQALSLEAASSRLDPPEDTGLWAALSETETV